MRTKAFMLRHHYRYLWRRLRQKFYPKPSVFLVWGVFPVAHESDQRWIVGYCASRQDAENVVELLTLALRKARHILAPDYIPYRDASTRMYHAMGEGETYAKQRDEWIAASDYYRAKLDDVFADLPDQLIPFPYSHLFERRRGNEVLDGPIHYTIEEVIQLD